MSFSLRSTFFSNARGVTFTDANGISWSINPNTNAITASYSGAGSSGANPTAKVGLITVNGSAVTFMRSDAAPPLDQSISPTWTGTHTFNLAVLLKAAPYTYSGITASVASGTPITLVTLPNTGLSAFLVSAGISGSGGDWAVAVVTQSAGATAIAVLLTNSLFALTVSGLAIQAKQTTGVNQVITYSILQIL